MVRAANEKSIGFYVGCLTWLVGSIWLVKNDLGVIAFVGSALGCIYVFGLRDKFESEEGSSAYSVFNKGGRAIMGGFTGEQFEQQMRGGFSSTTSSENGETGGEAPLTTTGQTAKKPLSQNDKVKRRSAAAAAAERRLQQQ